MRISRLIVLLLLMGAAGGGVVAYLRLHRTPVRAATAVRGSILEAVYASGPVEAMDRVEVKARVSGPVGALLVRVGDRVRRGQLLARINAPTLRLEVNRGQVELEAARERASAAPQVKALEHQTAALQAQLNQSRTEMERIERLVSAGAATRQALERARTQAAELESQIAANRAQQQDLRIALRVDAGRQKAGVAALRARALDTDVTAPMDGVVLARHVEPGEVVSISQNLLRVGDLGHLWIESRVDEADIGKVRTGMPAAVRLYAYPGKTFRGKVARILPEADRERKSFEVDLDLDDKIDGLRPGMTAEVNIVLSEQKGALVVPADAVRDRHVWVARDGVLHRREVETGVRDLARVEVARGLSEGDQVALEPEAELREGMLVSTGER